MRILKIYNSLKRKIESLKPKQGKKIKMFVCGPTVYDYSHLGHARVYIFFDFLSKLLRFLGYKVYYLMNITDIDDKIINRARDEKTTPFALARKYENIFKKNIRQLKINSINKFARASEFIPQIIAQIQRLMKKSYAYLTSDGSVYFRTRKFKAYGQLSGQKIDNLEVFEEAAGKEDPLDFALWKSKKNDFEPSWSSPWGFGRPGWHIEDTAITEKFFGVQYDLHGGGLDLIFPHHECEIAQQEAASGKRPFVRYWVHVNFLMINGEKMSKSAGNFITIEDFLKQYPARFLRFFILYHHYQSPIDITEKIIQERKQEFFFLNEKIAKLLFIKKGKEKMDVKKLEQKIFNALSRNLNTYLAITTLYSYLSEVDKLWNDGISNKKDVLSFLKKIDKFFQFIYPWRNLTNQELKLIKLRNKLRAEKNFSESDKIRSILERRNIFLEDLSGQTIVINLN